MTTWGGTEYDWDSTMILTLGAITLVGAIITTIVELRAAEPLIPVRLFKNRNMALTTLSGVILGLAMFGVLGYMPTYLQMVHTLSPTNAGLMMIPMMIGLIGTSTGVGFIIARTGRYKIYPVIGFAIPSGAPLSQVGTATAANNFFRQIGSALGASLVGSMFINNMQDEMANRLPQAIQQLGPEGAAYAEKFGNGEGNANSLTPDLVSSLPEPLRQAVLNSYNDGLTPVIALMVPLVIVALLVLLPLREERLKETID